MRTVHAVVVDQATVKPIESAHIRERHGDGRYESVYVLMNDSGRFEFNDVSGGSHRCPPVQLHLAKGGYVPQDREFKAGSVRDTVFLRAEPWRYLAP